MTTRAALFFSPKSLVALALASMLTACGGGGSAGLAGTMTTYPAFAPPYPLVTAGSAVAQVIARPRFVPVFFLDTPNQAETFGFLRKLAGSPEWAAVSQYGVGAAAVGGPVYLSTKAPASLTRAEIGAFVSANAPLWAGLDGTEIFVLYFPKSTTITDLGGVAGYHTYANTAAARAVPYAVIPNFEATSSIAGAQYRQLLNAATDPFPYSGYSALNHDSLAWRAVAGETEVGNMCWSSDWFASASLGVWLQPSWSNTAAAAGLAPCVGPGLEAAVSAFGGFPVLPDTYEPTPGNKNATVRIQAGKSATVQVKLFSYGPLAGPMNVSASQVYAKADKSDALGFSLDKSSGKNGDIVNLTITAPAAPLAAAQPYTWFVIKATLTDVTGRERFYSFPGMVTN